MPLTEFGRSVVLSDLAFILCNLKSGAYDVTLGEDQRNGRDEANRAKVDDAQECSLREVGQAEHEP
jgi:hypothetical protein